MSESAPVSSVTPWIVVDLGTREPAIVSEIEQTAPHSSPLLDFDQPVPRDAEGLPILNTIVLESRSEEPIRLPVEEVPPPPVNFGVEEILVDSAPAVRITQPLPPEPEPSVPTPSVDETPLDKKSKIRWREFPKALGS